VLLLLFLLLVHPIQVHQYYQQLHHTRLFVHDDRNVNYILWTTYSPSFDWHDQSASKFTRSTTWYKKLTFDHFLVYSFLTILYFHNSKHITRIITITLILLLEKRDDDANATTTTTPVATATNGPTVYVHLPSSTPILTLILIRYGSFASVSITTSWFKSAYTSDYDNNMVLLFVSIIFVMSRVDPVLFINWRGLSWCYYDDFYYWWWSYYYTGCYYCWRSYSIRFFVVDVYDRESFAFAFATAIAFAISFCRPSNTHIKFERSDSYLDIDDSTGDNNVHDTSIVMLL